MAHETDDGQHPRQKAFKAKGIQDKRHSRQKAFKTKGIQGKRHSRQKAFKTKEEREGAQAGQGLTN
jgi:hypothetical protein